MGWDVPASAADAVPLLSPAPQGLPRLAARVEEAIDGLVGLLGQPEAIGDALKRDYGVLLASCDVPAGAPFTTFGECLVAALSEALAAELTDEALQAWKDAYADAAASMQEAYAPSQLAGVNDEAKESAPVDEGDE